MVTLILPALAWDAQLSTDAIEVQTKASFELTVTVGEEGLDEGDTVRAVDPLFHGMRWAKWGYLSVNPQDCSALSQPNTGASGGLVSARTDGEATLGLSRNTNTRGIHDAAWTDIVIEDGALVEGDTVTFEFGSGGGLCGLQTSDRTMEYVPWPVQVDHGEGWVELDPPLFDFVTTRPVERFLVSVPSQAAPGEEVRVLVAALDRLGNPVPGYDGLVFLGDAAHTFTPTDLGVWETTVTFEDEGVHRLQVVGTGVAAESNPIRVSEDPGLYSIYWGDLHTHHGHSWTDETGFTRDLNHEYARDVVGLQTGCESLKAYPHELDWETVWPELQQTCETHTDQGYVAMLCFEWMGNENSPGDEGHHNVYYDNCEGPIAPNTTTGLTDRDDSLWTWMVEAEATTGARSLSIPHAPVYTGYNWRDRNDTLRPIAEIFSEWGDSSQMNGPASSVYDGFAQGHRMGVIAASDNHDGWIGNRWSIKSTQGGLGAFVATDLSRQGLFESLEDRSTYATTGHRPLLEFWVDEQGHEGRMGWEIVADQPTFHWTYSAEAEVISRVELLVVEVVQGQVVERLQLWTPDERDASGSFDFDWSGEDVAVWLHVVEGHHEAWASPIWLTKNCVNGQDIAELCGNNPLDSGLDSTPYVLPEPTDPTDDCGGCGSTGGGWWLLALLAARRR